MSLLFLCYSFGGIGREDRGDTSVPLKMFLDLVVKHFILEKLLLDRIFPKDSSRYVIESILSPVTVKLQQVTQHVLQNTVKEGEMAWERCVFSLASACAPLLWSCNICLQKF